MSRAHWFHADVRGDSITVGTRTGLRVTDVEVLVNGKVVAMEHIHGAASCELSAVLPGPPQRNVRVEVSRPKHHDAPRCTAFVDDVEQPLAVSNASR